MNNPDFMEIAQDSEDLGIDLDIDIFDAVGDLLDITTSDGFAYPAMLISGVKFNDVLRVLRDYKRESYRSFDVWVESDDGTPPVKMGSLPADLDVLLAIRYLGLRVTFYLNEKNVTTVDLKDPAVLEAYI